MHVFVSLTTFPRGWYIHIWISESNHCTIYVKAWYNLTKLYVYFCVCVFILYLCSLWHMYFMLLIFKPLGKNLWYVKHRKELWFLQNMLLLLKITSHYCSKSVLNLSTKRVRIKFLVVSLWMIVFLRGFEIINNFTVPLKRCCGSAFDWLCKLVIVVYFVKLLL